MSVIGDRMRELRGTSTLREMADAVGIKFNAWARYEAGEVLPGASIIDKICRVHAVSADWLLGLKDRSANQVISNSPNSFAISGNHISVNNQEEHRCESCPYKSTIKALQKLLQVD